MVVGRAPSPSAAPSRGLGRRRDTKEAQGRAHSGEGDQKFVLTDGQSPISTLLKLTPPSTLDSSTITQPPGISPPLVALS